MGRKCFVPDCKTGSPNNKEKFTIFAVPKQKELFQLWKTAILRNGIRKELTQKNFVCSRHFTKDDLIDEWTDGKNTIKLKVLKYKETAVPSVCLGNGDSDNTIMPEGKKKKRLKVKNADLSQTTSINGDNAIVMDNETGLIQPLQSDNGGRMPSGELDNVEVTDSILSSLNLKNGVITEMTILESQKSRVVSSPMILSPLILENNKVITVETEKSVLSDSETQVVGFTFETLWLETNISLPSNLWFHSRIEGVERFVVFSKYIMSHIGLPIAEKQLVINTELIPQINVCHRPIVTYPFSTLITSIQSVENILAELDELYHCRGGPSVDDYPEFIFCREGLQKNVDYHLNVWRHRDCELFVLNANVSCSMCKKLRKQLTVQRKRFERKTNGTGGGDALTNLRRMRNKQRKVIQRLRKKVAALKDNVKKLQCKVDGKTDVAEVLNKLKDMGLPPQQLLLIRQCIKLCKYNNNKSFRYNEQWMNLCMRLHVKGPKTYEFLRNNHLLPLPCPRTVRNLLKSPANTTLN